MDSDKPHTVILGQLLDPLAYAPVCPWSGGFTETLVSSFLLASFQADEIFDADGLQPIPRQLRNGSVYEAIVLDVGPALAPAAGPTAAHTIADCTGIVTEDLAGAGREQFGDTDINAEHVAIFTQRGFGNDVNPDENMIFAESAALHRPRPRQCQPFAEHGSARGRQGDALALTQRRQSYNQIEAAAAILDVNTMAEDCCTSEGWALWRDTGYGCCFLGTVDDRQRLFGSLVLKEGCSRVRSLGRRPSSSRPGAAHSERM
jgi:hypothetical protein